MHLVPQNNQFANYNTFDVSLVQRQVEVICRFQGQKRTISFLYNCVNYIFLNLRGIRKNRSLILGILKCLLFHDDFASLLNCNVLQHGFIKPTMC
jgi:hypothetical protein